MKTMFWKILIISLTLLGPAISAGATQMRYTWENPVGFIDTIGYTAAPRGYLNFCERNPRDCQPEPLAKPVQLTAGRMRQLNTVNMDVNDSLFFNTDLQGRDKWEYPTDGYGDCEDYVMEKRRRLIELGWPASALLITMAERPNEELAAWRHHVFLTVRTAQGDYILDNDIRPAVSWDKAARLYRFTMMQTPGQPKLWALVAPGSVIH